MVPAQDNWWRRNKLYVVAACGVVAGGAAAWQLYQSQSWASARSTLRKALATAKRANEACSSTAEALAVLTADLSAFLQSDSDEVPQSLRQLAKLAQCPDIQAAISATTASAVQGAATVICASPGEAQLPIIDRIIEAFLSDRGRSLVSLAVGAAARSSTDAFCDAVRATVFQGMTGAPGRPISSSAVSIYMSTPHIGRGTPAALLTPNSSPPRGQQQQQHSQQPGPSQFSLGDLVTLLTGPQVQQLLTSLTETGIRTAVGTYCERSNPQGMFEPLIAAISQPEHKQALIDLLTAVSSSFCREMAAACMAPAAAVASSLSPPSPTRPPRAATATPGGLVVPLGPCGSSSLRQRRAQGKPLPPHGVDGSNSGSEASDSSTPSSPRSGPGTPDAALLASSLSRAFTAGGGAPSSSNPSSVRSEVLGVAAPSLALQQQQQGLLAAAGGGQELMAAAAALGPMSSVISLLVQASRSQELRSLMLDVTTSTTREFVASVLPANLRMLGPGGAPLYSATFRLVLYRVYVLLSVLLFLAVYALSPRTLMVTG